MTTFYPKLAGKTKQDVLDSIQERLEDGYPTCYRKLPAINKNLLTDKRMQEFVNDEYKAMFDNIEFGDEAVGRETEKVLFRLAQKLSGDRSTKFNYSDDEFD